MALRFLKVESFPCYFFILVTTLVSKKWNCVLCIWVLHFKIYPRALGWLLFASQICSFPLLPPPTKSLLMLVTNIGIISLIILLPWDKNKDYLVFPFNCFEYVDTKPCFFAWLTYLIVVNNNWLILSKIIPVPFPCSEVIIIETYFYCYYR